MSGFWLILLRVLLVLMDLQVPKETWYERPLSKLFEMLLCQDTAARIKVIPTSKTKETDALILNTGHI